MGLRTLRQSLFISVLLFFVFTALYAQVEIDNPRVTVLPINNATGQDQYAGAAATITDTISLTLELLGSYELVSATGQLLADATADQVGSLAQELSVDNVIFGEIRLGTGGRIIFDMSLYDRAEGAVTFQEEWEAQSLLGVFETTDQLVQEFVSHFSGIRIGFGSIRITPSRQDVQYLLYVDGALAGENVQQLGQVLIGEREIEVRQVTVGGETTILRETVSLEENQTVSLTVEFPEITEAEIAYVAERRGLIEERLPQPNRLEEAEQAIGELESFFAEYPGVLPAETERHRYDRVRLQLAEDYLAIVDHPYFVDGEFAVTEDDVARYLDLSGEVIDDEAYDEGDGRIAQREARRNLAAMYEMFRLASAYQLHGEQYSTFYQPQVSMNLINRRAYPPYTYRGERSEARRASVAYQRNDRRRKPFWHWLVGGIGAAAAGTGGYIYATGQVDQQLDDASALQAEYENATDVDTIVDLRQDIEGHYNRANQLETIQWSTLGAGTGFLLTAIVSRAISVGRPERAARRFARRTYPVEMAVSESVFTAEYGAGEAGLLVFNRGRPATEGSTIQATPWFSRRQVGETVEIEGGELISYAGDDPRASEAFRLTMEPGLNMVILR